MNCNLPPANCRIIDISLPLSTKTACFPGDTPFSHQVTVSYQASQVINLTAFTMSPHLGTHADAPIHIQGNLQTDSGFASQLLLSNYLGPTYVIDCSPFSQELTLSQVQPELEALPEFPRRILFKTQQVVRPEIFEKEYAYFSSELISYLGTKSVVLAGIDTPSVDHTNSKELPVHHVLLKHNMSWLENVALSQVKSGWYYLIALPLNFQELEASPVRAILLEEI